MLFYSDFEEYFNQPYPQTLVSYDIASGEVETIMETTGWIDEVIAQGDWMAILYNPLAPESHYTDSSYIQISNGKTSIDVELGTSVFSPYTSAPSVAWSPDGRWLTIRANDGHIYRFDTETAVLEPLSTGEDYAENPFWSPDGNYLAFVDSALNLWNPESDTIETLPQTYYQIIGWQGSRIQDTMLYCGVG